MASIFNFKKKKSEAELPNIVKGSENPLTMDDETFNKLKDVIYNSCGIYYGESKKYLLESRISKRIVSRNLTSFKEYIDLLRSHYGRQEINQLFDVVTINETYFFRAEQQFEAVEKIIIPELVKLKNKEENPVIKIWSAGCSTGEEPYTLALIILENLKFQYPNVEFQIIASDISNSVLETAERGNFKEYSIKNMPKEYLSKYFTHQGSTYQLNDEVKNMIQFENVNLYNSKEVKNITNCDIIFCCNVLIYFDVPSKQVVISELFNSLNHNGYLFIGYSESLHGISKAFKLIHLPKSMTYKKE